VADTNPVVAADKRMLTTAVGSIELLPVFASSFMKTNVCSMQLGIDSYM
jgi:hypothetical protein